jgi:hypothetical protein
VHAATILRTLLRKLLLVATVHALTALTVAARLFALLATALQLLSN